MRRSRGPNAFRSARPFRSAKKAAVFIAASFSATAVATNWFMLMPSSRASFSTADLTDFGRRKG